MVFGNEFDCTIDVFCSLFLRQNIESVWGRNFNGKKSAHDFFYFLTHAVCKRSLHKSRPQSWLSKMHTFREWEISEVEKAYFAQLHTLTNSCCWRRSHHHHPMQPQNYIDIQGVLSNLLVLYMVHKSLVYCVYMRREKGLYCSNRVQWPWSRCRCLMSGFLQINCMEQVAS